MRTYDEALLRLKMHLATSSDQAANEAAVKLADWLLELMDEGAKLAIVRGTTVEAVQIKVSQDSFTVN